MNIHKKHIALGLLSGYPWCCITAYKVRSALLRIFEKIFGEEEVYFYLDEKRKRARIKWRHIPCIYHKYMTKKLRYYKCKECGWEQYGIKQCNICEVFHD